MTKTTGLRVASLLSLLTSMSLAACGAPTGDGDPGTAGTTGSGDRNRALMLFDLSGVIPPGSVITSAELVMDIVRQPSSGQENSIFSLRPVLQPWGEGVQVPADIDRPGVGAPAAPGEATWISRFSPGSGWAQPGGQAGVDFSTEISSTAFVSSLGEQVLFGSTPSLVANLQLWVDHPTSNFGWMLATESEDLGKTARGFASRESGFGPTLTVQFTAVPEPGTISMVCLCLLGLAAAARFRR